MKRRTAIKITAIGALAPKLDALGSALCHSPTGGGWLANDDKLRFFTAEERKLLDQLMEMIIPTDDHSPGAKAAEVSLFADLMVSTSSREAQKHWREGLKQMQEEAQKSSLAEALAKSAAHEDHPTTDLERFFRTLKHMTVNGYYTSAIGIHQDLQYQGNTYVSAFPGCDLNQIPRNQAVKQEEKTRQSPQPRAPRDLFR
jgi:Gluconate 2-dehydrogenase subunit 3